MVNRIYHKISSRKENKKLKEEIKELKKGAN